MSRKGCCLCDDAEEAAMKMKDMGLCSLEIIDVDSELELAVRYGVDVPVLLINGTEMMKHVIDSEQLKALLIRQ